MSKQLCLLACGLGFLIACGSVDTGEPVASLGENGGSSASGNIGNAGTVGGGGTGAVGGGGTGAAATDGGSGSSDSKDFETLSTCRAEVCSAGVQLIEEYFVQFGSDVGCVLRALRDRTPGRYTYNATSTWTNGNLDTRRVLVLADDGTVTYAREHHSSVSYSADGPVLSSGAEPARRCTLKPPSYFDACLAALQRGPGDGEIRGCLYGDGRGTDPGELGWFESCSSATPATCPK